MHSLLRVSFPFLLKVDFCYQHQKCLKTKIVHTNSKVLLINKKLYVKERIYAPFRVPTEMLEFIF